MILAELLADYLEDRNWRDDAACVGMDSSIFFPEKGQTSRMAKQVCNSCDVQLECLAWAMATRQEAGIWGGYTEAERTQLRRQKNIRQTA